MRNAIDQTQHSVWEAHTVAEVKEGGLKEALALNILRARTKLILSKGKGKNFS